VQLFVVWKLVQKENALAFIEGVAMLRKFFGAQYLHFVGKQLAQINEYGVKDTQLSDVDVIACHAPGTTQSLCGYKNHSKVFGEPTFINYKQMEDWTPFRRSFRLVEFRAGEVLMMQPVRICSFRLLSAITRKP
jgi:hypothetical protein